MKRFIVRYRVKKERAEENKELIRKVFEELHKKAPAGVSYQVFRGLDGVSFTHLVTAESSGDNPISQLAAFKAFQAGIRERCEEAPFAMDLELEPVGSFGV